MTRKKNSRHNWTAIHSELVASGMTAREFLKKIGIPEGSYWNAKRFGRIYDGGAKPTKSVPEFRPVTNAPTRITLPSGAVIEATSTEMLKQILQALAELAKEAK
jgi:hypothetical protein